MKKNKKSILKHYSLFFFLFSSPITLKTIKVIINTDFRRRRKEMILTEEELVQHADTQKERGVV
jgi:hypothetical protein